MVSQKAQDPAMTTQNLIEPLTPPVIDEVDFAGNGEISERSREETLFGAKGQPQRSKAASINKTPIGLTAPLLHS
jgi:hypothetical protein